MLVQALIWGLCLPMLPVCWLQGMLLRRRAQSLTSPEVPADWTDVDCVREREVRVLGVGDSVMAGYGLADIETGCLVRCATVLAEVSGQGVAWRIIAQKGAKASQVSQQVKTNLDHGVDLVVIAMGVNDVSGMTSLLKWQRAIFDTVMAIRSLYPSEIIFLGLPPMGQFLALPQPLRSVLGVRARMLDEVLQRSISALPFASHVVLTSEDLTGAMAADGYHPNWQGHAKLGQKLASIFLKSGVDEEPERSAIEINE